jgi:hypothetical protein
MNTDKPTTFAQGNPLAEQPVKIDPYRYADAYLQTCGMNREQRRKALKEHGLMQHKQSVQDRLK